VPDLFRQRRTQWPPSRRCRPRAEANLPTRYPTHRKQRRG